ncbi:MAG TPA: hypothetical protein VGV13_14320 [Methylomirabilota bacterium]|jgi:hypothetical protein|nr:hypothetical protein [Methylomirabilota bacterium]
MALVLVVALAGCARPVAMPNLPLCTVTAARPAIPDLLITPAFRAWLQQLVDCYEENCTAIAAARGSDVGACAIK